ncbi:hypothetical protein C0992_010648, partial [Termitomyces sp. T32_za158]
VPESESTHSPLPDITFADGAIGVTETGGSTSYVAVEESILASTVSGFEASAEAAVPQPSIRCRTPGAAQATEQPLLHSTTIAPELAPRNRNLTERGPRMRRRLRSAPYHHRSDDQRRSTQRRARKAQVQPESVCRDCQATRQIFATCLTSRAQAEGGHITLPLTVTDTSETSTIGAQISRTRLPSAPPRLDSANPQAISAVPIESEAPEVFTLTENTSNPVTVAVVDAVEETLEQRLPRRQMELLPASVARPRENKDAPRGAHNVPGRSIQPLRDAIHRHLGLNSPRRASRRPQPKESVETKYKSGTQPESCSLDLSFGGCGNVKVPEVDDTIGEASQQSEMEIGTSKSIISTVNPILNEYSNSIGMPPDSASELETEEPCLRRPRSWSYSQFQYDSPLTSQRGFESSFVPIYDEPCTGSSARPSTLSPNDAPLTTRWGFNLLHFRQTMEESLSCDNVQVLESHSDLDITGLGSLEANSSTPVAGVIEEIPFLIPPLKVLDRNRRRSGIPVPSQYNEGEISFVAAGILNLSP